MGPTRQNAGITAFLGNAQQEMAARATRAAGGAAEDDLVDHGSYFSNLPREHYLSPQIFATELRKVFSRQWLYAGQLSQVRKPGDYYVRDIGPESLIITRDHAGKLRAFFNVCRHRGSRICTKEEAGNTKLFVCPYHRWSFRNDGGLVAAPGTHNGREFDYADWGLHEAHCDSFFGSIFVYLAAEPPPQTLYEFLAARTADLGKLAAVQPERTKVAARRVYDMRCNWKTILENNSECYHCPGSHPTLCTAIDVPATYLMDNGEVNPLSQDGLFPFKPGMKTLSADGEWVCRKPLGTPQAERFAAGFIVFPNFCGMSYYADYGNVIVVEPVTVDRSRMICEWFVHEDAVEGVDYQVDRLIAAWDQTNREDIALAENNYQGVTSLRFVPGPHNVRREGMVRTALVSYVEMMNADGP